jgi:hypothetical protein
VVVAISRRARGVGEKGAGGLSLKPVLQSNEEGQRVVFGVEQLSPRSASSGSLLIRRKEWRQTN